MKHIFLLVILGLVSTIPASAQEIPDPYESVNRVIFRFNDTVDTYALAPIAREYKCICPPLFQRSISNFFDNIRYPVLLVSDVVQGKLTQAGRHTLRFLINSTAGIGGLFDVAKHVDPVLHKHDEDFGTALGYHGVGTGPFLMLPLLGPCNLRDGLGRIVDGFLSPTYYIDEAAIIGGAKALEVVDDRRKLLEATDVGKKGSLDYYRFIRSSYAQRRLGLIYDGQVPDALGGGDKFDDDPFVEVEEPDSKQ